MEYGYDQVRGPRGGTSLLQCQNIVGNDLQRRKNGRWASRHIIISSATTPAVIVNMLQVGIAIVPNYSSFILSVMKVMFLMMIHNNESST